jgi:hypothetical protein
MADISTPIYMTDIQENHLKKLRNVESTRQWNECRENVRILLTHMTEIAIVRVLLRQIARFLTDAQKTYPHDEDIIAEISQLEDVTSLKLLFESATSINVILHKRSKEPGINNFRNALKRLQKVGSIESASADYYDTILDVLSGILMAILDHQWGENNPELWHKSFWQETREDAFIRVKHFWSNPKTFQLNKALWNAVADDIESGLVI